MPTYRKKVDKLLENISNQRDNLIKNFVAKVAGQNQLQLTGKIVQELAINDKGMQFTWGP
jgi:hypothetical protein